MSKWDVYIKITRCFDEAISMQIQFAGTTVATSAKKAINNVRFRIDGKSSNVFQDECGEDWRTREFIAVPAGTDFNEVKKEQSK